MVSYMGGHWPENLFERQLPIICTVATSNRSINTISDEPVKSLVCHQPVFLPVHVAEITAGCVQIPQDYYIWNIELGNDVIVYTDEFINFLSRVYW